MQKVDNIGLLEAFEALARNASLQEAARDLGISRSALARRAERLEGEIGFRLFHRDQSGSHLTPNGKAFLERVRPVLKGYFAATAPRSEKEAGALLRISAPYSLGTTLLLPWVARYRLANPDVRFDLDFTLGPRTLLSTLCDLRFSHGAMPSEHVLTRPLGVMPRILAASPAYLSRFSMPESPSDLAQHSLLGSQDTVSQPTFTLTNRSGELVRLPYHPQVRLQDHTAAKAAALAGLGIGLHILTHDASAEIERGELVRVLPDWAPESCPISMLLPLSHPASPAVNRFADFIEAAWRAHPVLLPPEPEDRS